MPPSNENGDGAKSPDFSSTMASPMAIIDWNYARREMALNYLNDTNLQKLLDDLKKIASARRIHSDSNDDSEEILIMYKFLRIY
ncbi:hypothetical protein C2G38_2151691 [Gigaspora rosea]|uniref:Uncharacterized protein n=1 Tax=Gigaspora rosea TaxID=44941 RepID=A0A397WCM7_9GLOM|nr:hypothetical protein C2G38_2151691 [Gigaspora rosea]